MGIYLNPGNEGFQSALNSQIYVDKTDMLEYTNSVLDSEQRYICVSRPRRFGKSVTAEMLVAYYDKSCDSSMLFQDLKISHAKDYAVHRNKYDVIHIDVNSFRGRAGDASEMIILMQREIIAELKEYYPDAFLEKIEQLSFALSQVHKIYNAKFVIIIDEWDAVFRESKNDTEAQKKYIAFLRSLFKDAPTKKFIKLAYLTGILPIKKYGTESALNNFDELFEALYQRVTEINKYIDELKEMRTNINISSNKLEEDKEQLKQDKKDFLSYKREEEEKIKQEKESLKINYDRLQTIIDDLDKKLNEIDK